MAEAFRRRDTSNIPRRLRHAGVARAQEALRGAETRAAHALADRNEWDRKIAQLVERARGEAPQREELEALRAERSRALFVEAQRGADLADARAAFERATAAAPTDAEVAKWQAELEAGIEERRRAAELLADPSFGNRIREIRHALGDADGLGALGSEVSHIATLAQSIRASFTERNTIAKRWWMPGDEDGN